LNEISIDIANSDFITAKDNWIMMHNDFLQSLEIEFEQTLLSTNGLEIQKLKQQILVFEMLHKLDWPIRIYKKFFDIKLIANKLLEEKSPKKYQEHLDVVHSQVLQRLEVEFDLNNGRLQKDFPHRARFATSLLTNFFSTNYRSFMLAWLDTEEKSKEIFLMVLSLTVKTFEDFKSKLIGLIGRLKIGNETSIENILDEMILPFRKMYLQKEQSVLKNKVTSILDDKTKQLEKVQMKDVQFEFERNFLNKLNPISKGSSDSSDKDNFFKATMILEPALYEVITNYATTMFDRWLYIPIEQDVNIAVETLSLDYLEKLNGFFSEVCSKITDYLVAIDHDQQQLHEQIQSEKKHKVMESDSNNTIENIKASYRPPVEYFKFIFAFEDLVKVLVNQLSEVCAKVVEQKQLTSTIEMSRDTILNNMASVIKLANHEIVAKINLHCHYILSKHLKKSEYGLKKTNDINSLGNIGARDEINSFLTPFFRFLSENDDSEHNATRLLETLAANTTETLLAHYKKLNKNKKGPLNLIEDAVYYNELFEDVHSDRVRILYEKLKMILASN